MSTPAERRGATPLASLSTMEPWEAALIKRTRSWCHSPAGQARVVRELGQLMPPDAVSEELSYLHDLLSLIDENANRPMVYHHVDCACAGADECIFAHLVSIASGGELHDAALIASLLVRPCLAERVAMLAAHVGERARRLKHYHTDLCPTKSIRNNTARIH